MNIISVLNSDVFITLSSTICRGARGLEFPTLELERSFKSCFTVGYLSFVLKSVYSCCRFSVSFHLIVTVFNSTYVGHNDLVFNFVKHVLTQTVEA